MDIYYHLSSIATIAEGRASDRLKNRITELTRVEMMYDLAGPVLQQVSLPLWLRVVNSIVVKYSNGKISDIGFSQF